MRTVIGRQRRSGVMTCVICAGLALNACATGNNAPYIGPNQLGLSDSGPPPLAPGDQLKIQVFGEPELSGKFVVAGSGTIAMPLIGHIKASGMRVSAFRSNLHARLKKGYLTNPKVTVEVVNYRPVFIHGEVRSGGEIKYRPGLTFRDAIATAGGYTYRAQETYVLLVRQGIAKPVRVAMPNTAVVHPGDNIRVPERFF
ncbi:MAG: polysaccharide biosynthesis/export family protein [Pseudomonadota bacterium]